jgi:hypothetical protein
MSTAAVVAVVVVLMLLGIGMVTNQLLRLRRYLNQAPPESPEAPPDAEPLDPPKPEAG